MTKRRRILHADKIIQNVIHVFCLLMFLQLKGYYSLANNPILLYSTASDIRVANLSRLGKTNVIVKGLEQGSAVDFISSKNLICWSDQTAELIQCMNYNETYSGEKMRIVSEGLITPTGIAIDWYTDKIYWTDGETNRIEVISLEQKHRKVLFWSEVDLARAIAVVPREGLMFWTDWGEEPKIERAGMNGDSKTRQVIVKDNIIWPNGITIDYNNNLIYWVDAKLHFIDVIGFNGENRKRVVKGGLDYPYALTIFNDKFFWTDWTNWTIYSWDISTNGPIKEIIKSDPVPVDIKVYDSSRQLMPEGDYPCKYNNGGCSHLCLLAPYDPGYVCACPTGTTLKAKSNTTCFNSPQSLLVVAQRSMISKISLDSPDFTPYTLPLKDLKRALTVDFDPKSEYIYWADSLAKTISRARLDGSEQSVVVHSSGVPDSIAIDPLARNIYWTDPVADTITVARLDGSSKKVIIHDELYDPRAIALHPTAGWMFWSDWNEKRPKIERANLDGSERLLLVTEKVTWPNGIALDTVHNKLYWGDARTHKIEDSIYREINLKISIIDVKIECDNLDGSERLLPVTEKVTWPNGIALDIVHYKPYQVCNMDGSNRREIHSTDILHIFGLTLLGQRLYWTDMQRRTLDSIDKDTGLERQPVVEQLANMLGVKAFRVGEPLGTNPCVEANGGCSHLCFNRPKDYVCSCPLGLELGNDRKTCIEPEAFLVYSRKNVIGRLSIENANNDAVLPVKDLKEVSALEVHVSGSKIYWSDSKTKTINRCSVNGSNQEKILEWLGLVEGLAIDWSGQNIYWTDTATQRIEMARLDGSSRRTLIWQGLKKPKSIVLDPKKGYMYWSELGSKAIKRAAMDGSSPSVFVEQAGRVHALAIDYDKRTLYWAALDPPTIEYIHLNGSGRKLLADNILMPFALTLYGDRVFWGDWNTGLIEVAKKLDGTDRKTIHSQLDYITDLKVYHRTRAAGGSQCDVDNGGCSHLCLPLPLPVPGDYRCACPTHYRLNRDNITCSEPEEFLLFAQKNAVGRILVANGECNDAFIPLVGLRNVKAIEYDPEKKLLYWIEEDSHVIRRVPISYSTTSVASDSSVVVSGLTRPFHMVLDVLGRALYWTCLDTDSINATSIDNNSSIGVILSGENMMPRHLAFHQTKRVLIWNDIGLGAIMRANPDGSERTELARAANASALALDQTTANVYWAVSRQIHAVHLDGTNRRVVWQGGWVGTLSAYGGSLYLSGGERALMRLPLHRRDAPAALVPHVARLAATAASHPVMYTVGWVGTLSAYGGSLYLSGGERALMRLPLHRRDAPAALVPHVARLAATAASHPVPRSHPCYGGRACGGLAGACLAGGACGCGGGCPPRPACAPGHFRCHAPRPACIPDDWRCDGQIDCPDGSDEGAGCGACAGGVRCADGACADSLAACPAGALCPHATQAAFRCDEKLCLAQDLLCDGHQHCEDGSDEQLALCAQKEQPPAGRSWSAAAVCGAVGGAGVAGAAAWAALRCRRRPPPRPLPRHKPRAPPPTACSEVTESLCERYPQPTANPPPSPATASGGSGAGVAASRRRAYRHYRACNRVPPPTPASTDACESEPERAARAPPPSPAPYCH